MTTQISTFNFKSNPVRIETIQNEPYFCLTDVCSALAINNANSSRFRFNEDGIHKMYSVDKLDRKNEITFINEPNLYRIIFRSNKAEAVEFQNWVFEEVLPQIRKTGQYALPQPEPRYQIEFNQSELVDLINVWTQFTRFSESVEHLLKAVRNVVHGNLYSLPAFNLDRCNQGIRKTHPTILKLVNELPKKQPLHHSRKQIANF